MGEASPNTAPQAHPAKSAVSGQTQQDTSQSGSDNKFYEQVQKCIEDMAIHLKPLVENSSDDDSTTDSKRDSSPSMRVCTSDTGNSDKCKEIALSDADVHQEHSTNTSKNTVLNKIANSMTKLSRNDHIKSAKNMKRGTKGNMYVEDRSIKSASSPSRELQQEKCVLSRPMQRKLLSLLQCDMLEEEGQSRSARIARSLGERVVSELLVLQQFPHQLSSNLWAAVRTRGCQFLGPAMQEEVLKLILLALEDGSPLSRKVLVLFVVQKLEVRYPQASKTAIGHVVQLLYRASCFKVQKRDGESSLMQLKEEFRLYEALRREHDSQIVQIALEAGLRISPEQWSSLLYGDVAHKPHMQSIIDKHQSPQSFSQNIAELMEILQQRNPPAGSLLRLKPHLEFLSNIDPSPDCPAPSWENLEAVMRSLSTIIAVFVDYLACHSGEHGSGSIGGSNSQLDPLAQNTRYKTSMCRDFSARGICPRGPTCTFAHTQEELDKYRLRSRKTGVRGRLPTQEKTTSSLTQSESDQLRQVQLMSKLKDERSAKSATECAISGGDTGTDITKFLYSVAPKSLSPGSNSGPVQMKVPTDSQGFPHGLGTVKFSPAEEGRRPHVNMPTTRLTFSRPALDVQEPSYVATLNQQASLHPNTAQAQAFIPTQSIPMASTGLLPVQVPVSSAQAVNGINSDTSSGNFYNHHHHHHYQHPAQYEPLLQQQFSPGGALSSLKASSRNLMSLPAAAGESPQLSRDYNQYQNQAAQSNRAMIDQSLPQQHHQHVDIMPASQMVSSYPLPREDDTLQDLWLRKQEIIQHLRDDPTFLSWQDPSLYQADSHRAGFHGLDTVLSQNKQTREAMPKPVSDMFVATRSTQSLDKLVAEDPRPGLSRKSDDLEKVPLDWMGVSKNHYLQSLSSSPAVNGSSAPTDLPLSWHTAFSSSGVSASNVHSYHNGSTNGNSISARSDYQYHMSQRTPAVQNNASSSELGTYSPTSSDLNHQRGMYNSLSCASNVVDIHSSQADSEFSSFPGDDGDDNTIPFEQTKVSKFGPISRLNKTKCEYNAPVQVTADLSRHTVLAASKAGGYGVEFGSTAAHQTLSHCANVTSQAKAVERLSGEPAVKPTALERRSIWEQSPSPSYKNIAQLKAGAAGAVSNNEKLAYQLQAVELEISMKTGRKPEPVSKMIQAAVGPSQPVTTGVDSKGLMDMMATGHVTDCLRNMQLGSSVKAYERFVDWNGVSK